MATKDTGTTGKTGSTTGSTTGAGSTGAASATGDSAGSDSGMRATLDREFRATRDWVRSGKKQAVGQARNMVRELADTQKRQAVEGLKGFTGALRKAAGTLEDEQQDMIARYTTLAADEIDRVTDVLNDKEWEHLVSETRSLARRQPALFVGGAMVTGFLLARFLKSSGAPDGAETGAIQSTAQSTTSTGYGTQGGTM